MIMTADHDDRVVPSHSFKFAAALQKAQSKGNPILLNVTTQAGHGAGSSLQQQIAKMADKFAFILYHTK
jgi:prolyl oligopeptidase